MNLFHALLQNQRSKNTKIENERIKKGWNCTNVQAPKITKKIIAGRGLIRRFTKKLRTKS